MIVKSFQNKMKSERGATLMAALLLFVMCAVVGSVVLAAASSSAGRASRPDTDANKQRYSLESAAQMIVAELTTNSASTTAQAAVGTGKGNGSTLPADTTEGSASDLHLVQNWNFRQIYVNYVAGNEGDSAPSDKLHPDINKYVYDVEKDEDPAHEGRWYTSSGSYVLKLDALRQDTIPTVGQSQLYFDEEDDTQNTPKHNYWNRLSKTDDAEQKSNGALVVYQSQNKSLIPTVGASNGETSSFYSSSFSNLTEMRNVVAEGIFRHFWKNLSKYTTGINVDEEESPSISALGQARYSRDPWKGNALAEKSWKTIVSGQTYTIGTQDKAPLVILPPGNDTYAPDNTMKSYGGDMYPVFVQFQMDQDLRMIFHLYTGSENMTGTQLAAVFVPIDQAIDPKQGLSELWVIIEPDEDTSKVLFTSEESRIPLANNGQLPGFLIRQKNEAIFYDYISLNELSTSSNEYEDGDYYYEMDMEYTYTDNEGHTVSETSREFDENTADELTETHPDITVKYIAKYYHIFTYSRYKVISDTYRNMTFDVNWKKDSEGVTITSIPPVSSKTGE